MKRSIPILCALFALATYLVSAWHAPLFMDEYSFQRNVAYFAQTKSITPVYARYPPLYSYLIAPPIYIAFLGLYTLQNLPWSGLRDAHLVKCLFTENIMVWVWVARAITMLFAATTVFIAVRFTLRRYGGIGAVTAAALLLFDPFGIVVGVARYGLPDMCVACLVTAAVLMCFRAMESGTRRPVYWAAVLIGLAGSMKFNGLLAVPTVCLAAGFSAGAGRRGRAVLLALLLCAAGFAAGSPSMIFSPQAYAAELQTERGVLIESGHLGAYGTPWVWMAVQLWRSSPLITILLLLTVAHGVARRRRDDWLYLALLLPAVSVIGALQKKTLLYFVPVFPLVAIRAGEAVQWAWQKTEPGRERALAGVMLAAVVLLPAMNMADVWRANAHPDNTVVAREWMESVIPAGTPVILDWAYVPALRNEAECRRRIADAKVAGSPFAGEIERRCSRRPAYAVNGLLALNYSAAAVERTPARYLVTSSGCYARFFPPTSQELPKPTDPLYGKFMARRDFYETLFLGKTRFRPLKTFSDGSGPAVRVFKEGG